MKSQDRWHLQRAIKGNHKWFQDLETGHLACADNSGHYPDETDDGILFLNKEKPIVMGKSDHIFISTPVLNPTGGMSHIISGLAEMIYLVQEHGMQVEIRAEDGQKTTLRSRQLALALV